MNLQKKMIEKGPEMVRAAAKEIEQSKHKDQTSSDPKAISKQAAAQIIEEIKLHGKVTTSIPLSKIILEENVRHQFSPESIKELGESLNDVGLLHNIILQIAEHKENYYFYCLSGKRRVLAAKSIGWEKIEANITLVEDPTEVLYIGAIANLHESVFWLDNAILYAKLNQQGNSDDQIASRVKVNPRTVGWFRRLSEMSASCQKLAYNNPELFNSRWAQQVARHGELPPAELLEYHMRQMVIQKRTWHHVHSQMKEKIGASSIDKSDAIVTAHKSITYFKPSDLIQTENFLKSLAQSGFLTQSALKRILSEFFKKTPSQISSSIENDI